MGFDLGGWTRQLLLIGFLVLGLVGAAEATDYYVDFTSGADSNSGTSTSAPWKSLGKVNGATFQGGDTVNFKRASVWTGTLQVRHSGTSGSPITYRAYGTGAAPHIKNPGVSYGDSVIITGDWNIVQDFLLSEGHESGVEIATGADRNIVRNNEMKTTGFGVMSRGQFNLLTENHVHDLTMIVNDTSPSNDYGAVCFWMYAGNNEISHNRGVNCRAPSFDFGHDGGFVEVYGQGDNTYVHHNYAENNSGFFELGAGGNGSAANVRVAYNVVINPRDGTSVCFNTGSYNITVTGFKFENNTFVARAGDSNVYRVFGCRTDLSAMQVRNNIFYSDVQIANNGNFTRSDNLYYMLNMVNGSGVGFTLGSGEMLGNPQFVNVAGADLHLLTASPAIDAGIVLGYLLDFDDLPVPTGSAPDLGAHEFGAPLPPAPPSNLRISALSP